MVSVEDDSDVDADVNAFYKARNSYLSGIPASSSAF